MLRFKFRSIVVTNLRRLMSLLAATAFVLSAAAAQAECCLAISLRHVAVVNKPGTVGAHYLDLVAA